MFKLYEKSKRTCLDVGTEENIIETMGEYLKEDDKTNFLVVNYDEITTTPSWMTIHGKPEYVEYVKAYEYRKITEKTCVELKDEITEKVKVKSLQKK